MQDGSNKKVDELQKSDARNKITNFLQKLAGF